MRIDLPSTQGPVVVGLSGGADSVALLDALCAAGIRCIAVHCHFGLRGAEADRDMEHARKVAEAVGAEFRSIRFDTRAVMAEQGVSAEMACRQLRYEYFERVRCETGAEYIAVAHHRDDNIETFFLNLLRGAGIHGLKGMLPKSGHVIRPLLGCTRTEILDYLKQRGLTYVTDSTNAENEYLRNRLRNAVLPVLYNEFPGAADAIARSLEHLRGNEALYNSLLPREMPPLSEIKASAAPLTLLHELLSPKGFNESQCSDILSAGSGAMFVSANGDTVLTVNRGELMEIKGDAYAKPRIAWRMLSPADFVAPRRGALYLDSSAASGGPVWELRPWRAGDRMVPFGMKGSRLLSDIYASSKLPAASKKNRWVLTRNGVVLWAVGLRASAHFPITPQTTSIIELYETD